MLLRNLGKQSRVGARFFGAGPVPEDTKTMEKLSDEDRKLLAPFNYYGRHQTPEDKPALWQYLSSGISA